jgi:beta-phosphoglucomutase-like phosphatase (HAD superfamily)
MNLDASQCLAFEDSYNGIVSTTEANIKTLITVNEYTDTHDFTGAIVTLSNLGEPDQPFKLINGNPTQASFVNVAYLQELHAQHC